MLQEHHGLRTRTPARRRQAAAARESVVAESIALLVAILAIAVWAGPLSRAFGPAVLERARGSRCR